MKQLKFENLVPEEKETPEIIPIRVDGLQPRKVEELIPDDDILPDTYLIYPDGGYHPFYGVPNTLPRYQQKIWPFIKRIKFSTKYTSEKKRDNTRRAHNQHTLSQLHPTFHKGYYIVCLFQISKGLRFNHTRLDKNGRPYESNLNLTKSAAIHRLVALAWVPNPDPEKFDIVMHINNDPTNYLRENLKWGNSRLNAIGTKKNKDTQEQKYLNLVDKGVIKG